MLIEMLVVLSEALTSFTAVIVVHRRRRRHPLASSIILVVSSNLVVATLTYYQPPPNSSSISHSLNSTQLKKFQAHHEHPLMNSTLPNPADLNYPLILAPSFPPQDNLPAPSSQP